jgi:3-hydroxyisobutyrate dehydrogenase
LGLGTETVIDALDGGPLVSPWQAAKLQRIAKDDYSTQFGLSLALKDVHLALQAADDGRFGRARIPRPTSGSTPSMTGSATRTSPS